MVIDAWNRRVRDAYTLGGRAVCSDWGELGGETLWASEIEEFPIAVTKRRFGV